MVVLFGNRTYCQKLETKKILGRTPSISGKFSIVWILLPIMIVVVGKQGCRIPSFPNLSFFNFALRPFVVLLPKVFNYGV